jgi:hypothetical protein
MLHLCVSPRTAELAAQLADESRVSAELASARAEVIKAKSVNDKMQQGLDTLKQELLRNSGSRQ